MATRKVGRNPLRTMSRASSIESRSNESAEIKSFSMGTVTAVVVAAPIMHPPRGTRRLSQKTEQRRHDRLRRVLLDQVPRRRNATQDGIRYASHQLAPPLERNPTILRPPENQYRTTQL